MDGLNWRNRGACNDRRQYNPDWWTAAGSTEATLRGYARQVCLARCPVVEQCRAWADEHPELSAHSMYGGLWRDRNGKAAKVQPSYAAQVVPIRKPKPIDDERLRSLVAAGLSWNAVGRSFGVSRTRVQRRAAQLGLFKPEPPKSERCGEVAGYSAHVRRGEKPCDACEAAMTAYRRWHRRQRRLDGPEPIATVAARVRGAA